MTETSLETQRPRLQVRVALRRAGPSFQIGLAILVIYVLVSFLGPLVMTRDPYLQTLRFTAAPPSWSAPFGYDELGRDLLARVVYGGRITIGIALGAVIAGGAIGTVIGLVAGYRRGWVDSLLMRIIDTLLAFPSLILALAIVGTLGAGALNLAIAAAVYCIPQFARIMRATVMTLTSSDYIAAARVAGASSIRIAWRHLLPNSVAPLIVQTTYAIAAVILVTSGLSFLGLGVQPPSPEWGAMLSRGRDYLRSDPHIVMIPGIVIAVFILALNLVGDGLRKLLDPRTRGA